MVESEIAGNFPNQNNHHFANVPTGGSHGHHGQASHSTHHGTTHEDNENQPSEKVDNVEHGN
jgi:hypothetical protein